MNNTIKVTVDPAYGTDLVLTVGEKSFRTPRHRLAELHGDLLAETSLRVAATKALMVAGIDVMDESAANLSQIQKVLEGTSVDL